MSGMLNQGMGGMDPQALMQMLKMGQQDPFSKPMAGEGLMGLGGMSMPQPPHSPGISQPPGLMDTQANNPQQGMGGPQLPGMNRIHCSLRNICRNAS